MKLKKGIDLPLAGEPTQQIVDAEPTKYVGLLGAAYTGMKPTMKVKSGDKVKVGQPLWVEKNDNAIAFTAPASGKVVSVNRGHRRVLLSVTIESDGKDTQAKKYKPVAKDKFGHMKEAEVREQLLETGAWAALRTRPYSKVPASDSKPSAIFCYSDRFEPIDS